MADDTSTPPPVAPATSRMPLEANIPFVLMLIVACGYLGMLMVMSFHEVPSTNKDMLTTQMGSLGVAFGLVVGYYFGSSAGSKAKDTTIATIAAAPATATTTATPAPTETTITTTTKGANP